MAASPSNKKLLTAGDLATVAIIKRIRAIIFSKTRSRKAARATVKSSVVTRNLVSKLGIRASLVSMINSLATTRTRVMARNMVDRLLLTIIL
jgi:hypothetical protein